MLMRFYSDINISVMYGVIIAVLCICVSAAYAVTWCLSVCHVCVLCQN